MIKGENCGNVQVSNNYNTSLLVYAKNVRPTVLLTWY